MKKIYKNVLILLTVFVIVIPMMMLSANAADTVKTKYANGSISTKTLDFYLNDSKSDSYYPELSKLSMAFSSSAYSKTYVEESLKNHGFIIKSIKNYSSFNYSKPAYSIAEKKVDNIKYVTIILRGSKSAADWATDVGIGIGKEHLAFSNARDYMLVELSSVYSDIWSDSDESIYFITGHSYGGAVANLLATSMQDYFNIPSSRVFTYTFATPNVTKVDASLRNPDGKYNNIFNICNEEDPVTDLPTTVLSSSSNWGKYGRTYWFTLKPSTKGLFDAHDNSLYLQYAKQGKYPDKTGDLNSYFTTVSLSYNANGGTGAPKKQNVKIGGSWTISKTIPKKEGYKFLGWSNKKSETTANIKVGEKIKSDYFDKTIYAVWEKDLTLKNVNNTVAASYDYIYAIKNDGHLWAWNNGQSKKILDDTVAVKGGGGYGDYAIKQDGSLWGLEYSKGEANKDKFPTPKKVMNDVADYDIYLGGADSFGCMGIIKKDGSLWASTYNWMSGKQTEPIRVAKNGFVSVVIGGDYLLALKDDKSLWIWEGNRDGNTNNTKTTRFVKIIDNVKQMEAQDIYTALILKEDNSLWVWSYAEYAHTNEGKKIPKAIKVLDNADKIFKWSNLAADSKGTLWTWELKYDDNMKITFLKNIMVLKNIKDVFGSHYSGTALKDDGTLWQWNEMGTPKKQRSGLTDIEAGLFYYTYIKEDGSLWASGRGLPGIEVSEKPITKKVFDNVINSIY